MLATLVFVTGNVAAEQVAQPRQGATTSDATVSVGKDKPSATKKAKKASTDEDDTETSATTASAKDDAPVTASISGVNTLAPQASGRAVFTSTPLMATNMATPQAFGPSIIAPGDPRYPLPAEPFRAGLILGSGGLVAPSNTALAPTITSLLNPSSQFINSGALNLNTVNITSTFQSLGIGAANLVNLTPTSTAINGTLLGQNQHLTLLGGVTSDSYITNINRGTDNFGNGPLGGILLPGGSPAWSADCASLLGIPLARCWAVNPAQDNQVIVGDRATANGSQEVVIGRGASHTLPSEDANSVFPGAGRNDPNNPSGVPTNDFASRKGNSVVIGDSAAGTANAQTILGANATSTQVNSVVLGNASLGDRAAQASYTPYGLTAAQASVGAVSVGSTGNERQIAHVAAGSDNYDAVNVLQLKGALAGIGALDLLAVTYDPDANGLPTNSITLKGTGTGTVGLHNLAPAALSATSTDAVNGTQLNTTNQAVATYFGGTTTANGAGVFTAPTFNTPAISTTGVVTPGTANNVTTAFSTVGTSLTALNTQIANITAGTLPYLKINSTGAPSTATGVDGIALGAGASAGNANSLALGAGSTTTVGAQTGYTAIGIATPQSSLGEVAIGTRKITGLAAGSAATDAVNVAQLTGVSNTVTSLGKLAVLYDADGAGNALNHVSLVGAGGGTVGLGNLGPAALSATSTDAVNGTQLNTTNQAVATFFGGTTTANGAGVFTAPTFNAPSISSTGVVTPGTASDVTTAFSRVGGSLTALNTQISNITAGSLPYLKINSTGAPSTATGVDGIALGAGASAGNANSLALGAGSTTTVGAQTGYTAIGIAAPQSSLGEVAIGTRKLTGLAAGSAATDAVNVAQLTGVNNAVTAIGKLAVQYDADGAGNATNHVSLVGTGAGSVGLGNLGAGAVTATSLDAVNGTQLFGTNTTLAGYLGAGASFTGGVFTPPAFSIGSIDLAGNVTRSTYGTVGAALSQLDTSVGNVNTRLNALSGADYLAVNSTAALPTATGAEGIAIGGAATAVGASGVAIGNGASANNANSVAIGAGSVTTVGAQTGYVGYGLAAPQTSLGEVNVGTRKITGVAAGSIPTDAVNVAQLSSVGATVTAWAGGGATYDAATGTFTAPLYALGTVNGDGTVTAGNYGSTGGALSSVNTSLGNLNTRLNALSGASGYVKVNSTAAAATATGAESVAIGGASVASVGNAIAIGNGASATNANSIALGSGAATTVGAQTGYTAYGIVAPQTSSGELNLGNRKITGVAPGTLDTDAANVQQLRAVSGDVGALGRLAVRYDDDGAGNPTNNITLTGTGTGTVGIHNVAPGALSATSHDAVNGTQLNTTNQAVATILGGGTTVDAGGNFTGPTYAVPVIGTDGSNTPGTAGTVGGALTTLGDSLGNVNTRISSLYTGGLKYVQVNSTAAAATATGAEGIAIGGGATAANANSVALGGNSATTVGARTNYTAYALTAPQNSTGEVNIGNRQLTGVAAGFADGDAVNVAQLRAVNDNIGQATAASVTYDLGAGGTKLNHITLTGGTAGAVGIGNLANGAVAAGSLDAVNGSQLFASNSAMVGFFGAGAAFDPATAVFTAPAFALRPVDASGNVSTASYGNVGAAFSSLDGSVNVLNARVNSLASGLNSPYLAVTSTQAPAQATGTESVAIGGGTVASAADAVAYGSQAQAVATGASALGVGSQASVAGAVALGSGSVASRTGSGTEAYSGVAIPAQGAVSVGSTGSERQIVNVAGGTADTDAVNLRQLRAVANLAGSIGASSVQYDDATHTSVTLNAGGAAARIGNVAAGSIAQASADAITGGQLWNWTQNAGNSFSNIALYNSILALQQGSGGTGNGALSVNNSNNLPNAASAGGNSVAVGAGASSASANSTVVGNGAQATANNAVALGQGSVADRANTVSVGSKGAERQIANVAAGTADTDAANVSQVNAVRAAGVHYDTRADGSVDYGNVSLGAAGTPAVVHNVAAGTATTDAANIGQLNQVADWSRSYTDQRVNAMNRDIQNANNRASAGVASAMAMAGLPQATTPGRNMAAIAGGTFRGESSIAVGLSTVSDGGGWVYKLSGTANSRGDAGFSVGAGMEW
ncbi:MAG: Autotransporter adhesin SadA [Luteibacter sp.]|nr:MAG: Autotransporter adhesin SadA [Luteibacter sp.]